MALGVERVDGERSLSVVFLRGKLMLGEDCRQLDAILPGLFKDGRTRLIFEMSGVTHIDSTGIGRFIDIYGQLGKLGGTMRMVGAKGTVRDSFRVTRLDTVFPFFATVDEAKAGL